MMVGPSSRSPWITGRIPGLVPGRESGLTRSGEPVERKTTMTPGPTGKLDAGAQVLVSGPEGELLDWRRIDWRRVEDQVRRLRQRIFTASRAGDLRRVRRLQRLMLRSRANTLLSVRRGDRAQRRSLDITFVLLGDAVGHNWRQWKDHLSYIDYAVVAIAIGVLIAWLTSRGRRGARGRGSTADT